MLIILAAGQCCFSFAEGDEAGDPAGPILQLKPAEVTVEKGRGVKITPSVANLPKGLRTGQYTWKSSDPQVAVYINGAIRGLQGGEAVVTCSVTLSDGSMLQAECPVNVVIPVSGVRAAETSLTVTVGDVFLPEIEVFPEDASNHGIRFTVSDETILAVGADGRITAMEAGKATITAESADNPAKKARITVTVNRRIGKTEGEIKTALKRNPYKPTHKTQRGKKP